MPSAELSEPPEQAVRAPAQMQALSISANNFFIVLLSSVEFYFIPKVVLCGMKYGQP